MVRVQHQGKGLTVTELSEDKQIELYKTQKGSSLTNRNYASLADAIMKKSSEFTPPFHGVTMSKLRGIYGNIMNVYSRIDSPEAYRKYQSDIQYLKVKLAYECGRDENVKKFIGNTFLLESIDNIKSYDHFMLYCRYAESIVAYFKFYGGEN